MVVGFGATYWTLLTYHTPWTVYHSAKTQFPLTLATAMAYTLCGAAAIGSTITLEFLYLLDD